MGVGDEGGVLSGGCDGWGGSGDGGRMDGIHSTTAAGASMSAAPPAAAAAVESYEA